MKIESYDQGTPSWIDLGASDQSAAKTFYASIFGWTYEDNPMGDSGEVYSMAIKDGSYAAAIYTQASEEAAMGIPPNWKTYLSVDDVEGTTSRVSELGGTVLMGPFDVFDAGRMSMITDPSGGLISIWQAKQHIGAGVKSEHGALTWSELLTNDPKAASDFFVNLLGVGVETGPMGDAAEYTVIMVGTEGVGGIMKMPEHLVEQNVPPHWEASFQVDNVDETAGQVSAAGGNVLLAPDTMESVGRISVVQDPQGAVFGLITPE